MSQQPPNPNPAESPDGQQPPRPEQPPRSSYYPEVAPGVPRYGQYAPGYQQGQPQASAPAGSAARELPRQVRLAAILIMIAGAIQLAFGVIFALSTNPAQLRQEILRTTETLPNAVVSIDDGFVQSVIVASVVIQVLIAACYFWIAVKIQAGRNWARITGTILAALSVVTLTGPLSLLPVGLGVLAMVYCWLPKNRGYFTGRSTVR